MLISSVSLVGLASLKINHESLHKVLILWISLSAGSLMGSVFLDLLPEAIEIAEPKTVFAMVLASFFLFFLIEKLFHWRHCHDDECHEHSFGYLSLLGDSVHNFVDGLTIAAAFMTSPTLGLSTTFAIMTHELPQEVGDFGVLLKAGFSHQKALLLNFVTAVTAIVGAILGYFLINKIEWVNGLLLPIAAGGFLYIAASDLLPEINKERSTKKIFSSLLFFAIGIFFIWLFGEK
jgi:zinc and cadmium transporter